MVLDEPKQNDEVTEVDGMKIVYDYTVGKYAKSLSVICRETVNGKKFVVKRII